MSECPGRRARGGEPVIAAAAEVPYTRNPAPGVSAATLFADAIGSVLDAAGTSHADVDGLGVCSFSLAPDHAIDLAVRLGLSLSWVMEERPSGASALGMLANAIRAVQAGDATSVVLVAGGRASASSFASVADNYNLATREHLAPLPYAGPNTLFALLTRRHMAEHDLAREDYGRVAVAQRRWAARNPGAVYRAPMQIEDYLRAPLVADPLSRYDCVPLVTGADAVLVTTRDRVEGAACVSVKAIGSRHNADQHEGSGLQTGLRTLAPLLWSAAEIEPADIDLACIYDDYPAMVLVQLDDIGLIPEGDVARFARTTLAEGRWPLNTSGGMLSAGQASGNGGMHGLVEAVTQLLGQAGDRQIDPCRTAVVTGYGSVVYRYGASASMALLERVG